MSGLDPVSVPPWCPPAITAAAAIAAAGVAATGVAAATVLLLMPVAVHGCQHEADVGGEQVVHLVAE